MSIDRRLNTSHSNSIKNNLTIGNLNKSSNYAHNYYHKKHHKFDFYESLRNEQYNKKILFSKKESNFFLNLDKENSSNFSNFYKDNIKKKNLSFNSFYSENEKSNKNNLSRKNSQDSFFSNNFKAKEMPPFPRLDLVTKKPPLTLAQSPKLRTKERCEERNKKII